MLNKFLLLRDKKKRRIFQKLKRKTEENKENVELNNNKKDKLDEKNKIINNKQKEKETKNKHLNKDLDDDEDDLSFAEDEELEQEEDDESSLEAAEQLNSEPVKEHFYTFQVKTDLFCLLYTSIVFKWINSDRLIIIVNDIKTGYTLELFLRNFKFNPIFIDPEMPLNSNIHFVNQFIKGVYPICICFNDFKNQGQDFQKQIIDKVPIPPSVIFFDCLVSNQLLEYYSFHVNTRSIHHFVDKLQKQKFAENYQNLNQLIHFDDYQFDEDQMCHLRYRCDDIYHHIGKSDIKKAKLKRVNQELLHSKNMKQYFDSNPNEKNAVISAIQENSIRRFKPSATYLPSYLIHKETQENVIKNVIDATYNDNGNSLSGRKRRKPGKMEKYLEALDNNEQEINVNF